MSLSGGHPAPQLRIDCDDSGGWYAGGLASRHAPMPAQPAPAPDAATLMQMGNAP